MSYLYLNFYDNLNQGSKSWDDFFTLSLTEQYDSIKRRIGRFAPSTLQELVSACCPLTYQTYYVSMPGFDRQTTVNKRGKECIYNIVIRPEKSAYSANFLSAQYDLIFIGDVTFGNVIDVTIVDCDEKESSEEGSTSKINKQEADVIMALLTSVTIRWRIATKRSNHH